MTSVERVREYNELPSEEQLAVEARKVRGSAKILVLCLLCIAINCAPESALIEPTMPGGGQGGGRRGHPR